MTALTNTADPGEGAVWGAMLVAMAAMFVAALAVPDSFGRHGVVFGVAFLIVNIMHAYEIIWCRKARARTRALRVSASAP